MADCMHNYLLYEHLLQVHLVPPERVMPKLYGIVLFRLSCVLITQNSLILSVPCTFNLFVLVVVFFILLLPILLSVIFWIPFC